MARREVGGESLGADAWGPFEPFERAELADHGVQRGCVIRCCLNHLNDRRITGSSHPDVVRVGRVGPAGRGRAMKNKAAASTSQKNGSSVPPKKGLKGRVSSPTVVGAVLTLLVALLVAYYNGLTEGLSAPLRTSTTTIPAANTGANDASRRPTHRSVPTRTSAPASHGPQDAIALQNALREQARAKAGSKSRTAAEATKRADMCADKAEACSSWADAGECDRNPAYMRANCPLSCRLCVPPPNNGPETWQLPPLPGVDWAALEAADSTMPAPSDEELALHCPVASLLSPMPIRGLHVLCRLPASAEEPAATRTVGGSRLAVWRDADRSAGRGKPSHVFSLPAGDGAPRTMAELLGVLGARLRFVWRGAQWQPPAVFTADGLRLQTLPAVASRLGAQPLCLFEGGQFIWPPGEVGSVRQVPLPDGHLATVRTLSVQPVVLSVDNFLRPHETGYIIERAAPHLVKSGVALKDHDIGKQAKEFRTSSQYFLPTDGDASLEDIDARVQALLRVPITHAEYIQVLRYNHLEHYSAQ